MLGLVVLLEEEEDDERRLRVVERGRRVRFGGWWVWRTVRRRRVVAGFGMVGCFDSMVNWYGWKIKSSGISVWNFQSNCFEINNLGMVMYKVIS